VSVEDDSFLDEIHEVRRQISERYGNDPGRLVEHYMEYQEKLKGELRVLREARAKAGETAPPDEE
jgi:glycyl-tRNA synthetase alpha subunit